MKMKVAIIVMIMTMMITIGYSSVQIFPSSLLLSKNIKIKIHRIIIWLFFLYGYETWPRTLKKKFRSSVFENRVLKKMFGLKRDKVTGEWSRLRFEEVYGNRGVEKTAFRRVLR